MSSSKKASPSPAQPLIPERYLDVPSQRLYYLSFGLLCQAIKLIDFGWAYRATEDNHANCRKWLFIDFMYCAILAQLRIPRLNYSKAVVLLQIASLWFLDGLMFGGISFNTAGKPDSHGSSSSKHLGRPDLPATPEPFNVFGYFSTFLDFAGFSSSPYGTRDPHLLGQHTVHMSPISTAELNPIGQKFCLGPPGNSVLVPILLNNTIPSSLKYSLTPLGHTADGEYGKIEYFDLTVKDLKAIEQSRIDGLRLVRPSASAKRDLPEFDEYDEDEEEISDVPNPNITLQKTQSIVHIQLTKPGTVRLERVRDTSNIDARLAYSSEVTIVPCPRVEFVDNGSRDADVRCAGQDTSLELVIDIHGVPPLSLRWFRIVNGRREQFLVEGIEGGHDDDRKHKHRPDSDADSELAGGNRRRTKSVAQELRVPLAVSLDAVGTYLYVLEEIVDGLGNTVRVGSDTDHASNTKTARSLMLLRRPTMSFKHCGPGNPTSLLVGSDASLLISVNEADMLDAPWEVELKYQPPIASDDGGQGRKRVKPWKKTFQTQGNRRELTVGVNAPGEYMITGVKGKRCNGDVLAPETCKVVEKPLPTAEIEWKRIHECSGDTGVSASLILHGTPPFQVYYRSQRDKEPPREISKTFISSRGELTIQPERSGHYVFTFVQMSDANYKKVELKGPSIDQVVHPLAGADFAGGRAITGTNKRIISSCEGGSVNVDVDLRGTGPWNLEVQVVGPRSSEILQTFAITASRMTLQVPIPKDIDRDGGTFDVELVSVEDAYGCKRPISVPGVSVKVRRVKPTVKFYSHDGNRHVTVLEHERASLPLRLTGDGPWRLKYRRAEAEHQILTAALATPNDHLLVSEKGLYEILEIVDSQCPGSVIADASTYRVDWLPKPSAKLSLGTEAIHTPHNNSHILPPICEGLDDHVDLDLTGRPPFQIMYNVARDGETGGTKLLDQPTFNSIQPRTRFELHTSKPGRIYYEVKQIGDAAYPLSKYKNGGIPRSERLLFEQQVSMRPSAQFKNRNRITYCLNDAFIPLDPLSADGVVHLDGTPPFQLRLSIKNLAVSQVETRTIELRDTLWKVDLPSYNFKSIGPHLIKIESVLDASGCAQAALDPSSSSIWVDVAETATIVPIDKREDFCVGDVLQFQLEGIPPWTIGYKINAKPYIQEAKVSPFALLQQQPGQFSITSIAHQQKVCKAALTDLRFAVHPLPSAHVGHGKKIFQDIHEGDQAEIVFTLIGEPPFTFTYQRTELASGKGGKLGKVLETHTVSRVTTKEYSIYSALEGTWTVTSISDRYCRYPPAQPDVLAVQRRQ